MKKTSSNFLKFQTTTVTGAIDYIWKHKLFFVTVSLICLSGCGGVGPESIARDRFAYTDALADSWKRQMLLNVVKVRYADAPVFLEVSSVVNQYSLETELEGSVSWNAFLPTQSEAIGVRGRYADRPTITYQPLTGEKFTRSLMTPIPPAAILSLIQAGWRADASLIGCVQAINGNYNRSAGRMQTQPADPEFYKLANILRKIQTSRVMGTRIRNNKGEPPQATLFFIKKELQSEVEAEINEAKKLLGLNPELQEFKIVYGALAENDTEIAILSRSMLEIILEMASYIDVPQKHLDEKRASVSISTIGTAGSPPKLMQIHSGTEKPDDAYVKVQYRDHWFWIDDTDFQSKRMFSFLMFLFSLNETGAPSQAPILTIGAEG